MINVTLPNQGGDPSEGWNAVIFFVLIVPLISLIMALFFLLTLLLIRGLHREVALRPQHFV